MSPGMFDGLDKAIAILTVFAVIGFIAVVVGAIALFAWVLSHLAWV